MHPQHSPDAGCDWAIVMGWKSLPGWRSWRKVSCSLYSFGSAAISLDRGTGAYWGPSHFPQSFSGWLTACSQFLSSPGGVTKYDLESSSIVFSTLSMTSLLVIEVALGATCPSMTNIPEFLFPEFLVLSDLSGLSATSTSSWLSVSLSDSRDSKVVCWSSSFTLLQSYL